MSGASPAFLAALDRLPTGYTEGRYGQARWGATLTASADGRRRWLWAEELGAAGRVSFNLYMTAAGLALRPCEMPAEDVVAFVLGYEPDAPRSRNPAATAGVVRSPTAA